jgi:hypothetical protein
MFGFDVFQREERKETHTEFVNPRNETTQFERCDPFRIPFPFNRGQFSLSYSSNYSSVLNTLSFNFQIDLIQSLLLFRSQQFSKEHR